MKYKRLIISVSILAVIFGGIAISKALGWWQTSGSRNLGKGQGQGNSISESLNNDNGNGYGQGGSGNESHDEEAAEDHGLEISGSTTVGQALDMGIPDYILKQYLGDITNKNALVKDLITANGLSFGKTKTILNQYIDID